MDPLRTMPSHRTLRNLWPVLALGTYACFNPPGDEMTPARTPAAVSTETRRDEVAPNLETSRSHRPLDFHIDCDSAPRVGPPDPLSKRWNEQFGLTCGGRPARYVCPIKGRAGCFQRFLVPVDEKGEPLDERFRDNYLCGEGELHGCTDAHGREVIPFIHSTPILFTASGYALVKEERLPGERQGEYFYINARYEQRLKAMTVDCIPEPWLPLEVVRYEVGGKIGFLNLNSGMVTPPRFDAAYSFYGVAGEPTGRTLVCVGCDPQRWTQCAPPEAHCTGTAFMIDEHGNRLDRQPDEEFVEYWWCKRNPGKKFVPEPEGFCQ